MPRREEIEDPVRPARPGPPSVQRRRLIFITSLAPGVLLAVLGVQLGHQAALVLAGALLVGVALIARRISQRRFLASQEESASSASSPLSSPVQELAS